MKRKTDIPAMLNLAGIPLVLIVVGLILIVSPDSASALVSKVLALVLILHGVVFLISSFTNRRGRQMALLFYAIICLVAGIWLARNPLALAWGIGKFLGILLGLRGIRGVLDALRVKNQGGSYIAGLVLGALTLAAGLWMVFSPLAPSRILMTVVGIVFVVIGVANLLNVRSGVKALLSGEDPNIIDADE